MKSNIDQIELLITKYLSGNILPEEFDLLKKWKDASSGNKKIFDQSRKIWKNSQYHFTADEKGIDREKVKDAIIRQISKRNKRERVLRRVFRVAAMLTLPVMLILGWYFRKEYVESDLKMCKVITPSGQISHCILSDGTEVWLNSESTIQYHPTFKGAFREVKLSGQAFFNVTRDETKPFIVNTSFANVKVLGTSFDVKAYDDENIFEAILETGKVELKVKDQSQLDVVVLSPGEQAVYDRTDGHLDIEKVDARMKTAWKSGKYIFKDADFATIINALEKMYGVKIHVENESISSMRYRGMFEYDQNILDALEALERTANISYRIEGRDVWLK